MSGARLAGVLVYTSPERFPQMRAFYANVMGLPIRSDREGFVNFEWGTLRLTVAVHADLTGGALDPKRIMVNFEVSDIHEAHRHLIDASVPCLRPPEQEEWGGWVATFTDPDGNIVQLLELAQI